MISWVADEIRGMGDWEYRVVDLPGKDPKRIEESLNALGADRWECIWVEPGGEGTRFILKRPASSLLSQIPFAQLIRLAPTGGSEGE